MAHRATGGGSDVFLGKKTKEHNNNNRYGCLEIPYILESNPHPFYSSRGLKKSDADWNRVRIRFAVVSWILEK